MNSDKITITKYFKIKDPSALVAIFSFKISFGKYGPGIVNDAKLFQKNSHLWIKMPDKEYLKEGKKYYAPICALLEKEGQELLEKEVLEAIREYQANPPSTFPYPMKNIPKSEPPIDDQELDLPF